RVERFSLEPSGPFSLAESNTYFGGWPTLAADPRAAALSLDVDGSGFPAIGERDPVIGNLQKRFNFARPVCFHSPYEAAAALIIGHRLSIAQTRSIRAKLSAEHGEFIEVEGERFAAFPR